MLTGSYIDDHITEENKLFDKDNHLHTNQSTEQNWGLQ